MAKNREQNWVARRTPKSSKAVIKTSQEVQPLVELGPLFENALGAMRSYVDSIPDSACFEESPYEYTKRAGNCPQNVHSKIKPNLSYHIKSAEEAYAKLLGMLQTPSQAPLDSEATLQACKMVHIFSQHTWSLMDRMGLVELAKGKQVPSQVLPLRLTKRAIEGDQPTQHLLKSLRNLSAPLMGFAEAIRASVPTASLGDSSGGSGFFTLDAPGFTADALALACIFADGNALPAASGKKLIR